MRALDADLPYEVYPVARVANYIARRLGLDPKLRRIGVRGEITGYAPQPNGTVYFDLKDRDALIKCVAWSEAAATLPPLANGQAIVAVGGISTYAKKSSYQLNVYAVEQDGAGRLHALYEALKRRLEAEGLFAQERKRALPPYPFRVALVSSRTANGAGDFRAEAAALAPHVVIELFETSVQGDNAASEIVRALDRASRAAVDLVVLARGGGSYEDLFVFNDERVVRALARCAHPTVSAIGHEADAPLTDFVADYRAPTPSSAAKSILPSRATLQAALAASTGRLDRSVTRVLDRVRRDLARIEVRSPLAGPGRLLLERRQVVDMTALDLRRALDARSLERTQRLAAVKVRLEACNPSLRLSRRRELLALASYRLQIAARAAGVHGTRRLEAVAACLTPAMIARIGRQRTALTLARAMLDGRDPTKILQRGYAIVTHDGAALRDAGSVAPGTLLTAQLARGTLTARVETIAANDAE